MPGAVRHFTDFGGTELGKSSATADKIDEKSFGG